jgi:hypothetical protein
MMQVHNTAADTVPTNFTRNTILPCCALVPQ